MSTSEHKLRVCMNHPTAYVPKYRKMYVTVEERDMVVTFRKLQLKKIKREESVKRLEAIAKELYDAVSSYRKNE